MQFTDEEAQRLLAKFCPSITADKLGHPLAIELWKKYEYTEKNIKKVLKKKQIDWNKYFELLNELAIVSNKFLDAKLHLTTNPMHSNYRYALLGMINNLMNGTVDLETLKRGKI